MTVIDVHTHAWPDAVAGRALGAQGLAISPLGDGTVAGLRAAMDAAGVDRSVVLGVANTADRIEPAHRFVGSLDGDRFIGFGSAHADADPAELLASLRRHGLRGVKVHPLFQDYALDDPGLLAVLDALRGEFPAIVHVGAGKDDAVNARCTPPMLAALARQLPGLDLIACHYGGYLLLDEAEEAVVGQDVYLDTSWPPTMAGLDPARIRQLIERHGTDRVVFGSDWPMTDPAAEIAGIRALGLPDADTDAILGGTLSHLLGLESP